MRIADELAEQPRRARLSTTQEHIDRQAEARDTRRKLTGWPASPRFGRGKLRIGEDEIAEEPAGRPARMRDAPADRRRIEHMAKIDGEDRQHDQPGATCWPNSSMPTIWLAPA